MAQEPLSEDECRVLEAAQQAASERLVDNAVRQAAGDDLYLIKSLVDRGFLSEGAQNRDGDSHRMQPPLLSLTAAGRAFRC